MKLYFKGCSGIKNPVDLRGKTIKKGDLLTWNFHGDKQVEKWMTKPCFMVKEHNSGNGFYGEGIKNPNLYLHDFEFKFCEIITEK